MLCVPTFNCFQWSARTTTNPTTTPGVSVTAGSGAKGSWVSLLSALSNDVYLLLLWICNGNASAAQRDYLVDIGVDPAGGTSYSTIIGNILSHQASNAVDGGRWFYFPYFIKAGSTVGVRAQGNGANTIRVAAIAYGRPVNPEAIAVGQYSETLGVSGNGGTSITPGTSGAEGSWVSLGTTTRHCWFWQLCVGFSNATTTSQMYFFDMAIENVSTPSMFIIENLPIFHPGTAERTGNPLILDGFCDVPEGSTIYVRGSASGTPDTGCNAVVIGIGG